MFNASQSKRRLALATSGGVAIATLLGTGLAAADNNWTITVKNGGKVPADITILLEGKAVGGKASGVRPDGTATITIPATGPATKSKYSWKAEYSGKTCGSHSVDISGNTTVSVTCDAAPPPPPPSTAPPQKPADNSSSQPKPPPPNLRLKTPAELEKEIDDTQKDANKINDELEKVDTEDKRKALQDRAAKDRETINRIKTILNGQRSVIETTPQDWTVVKQKTTDTGDKLDKIEKQIFGCKPTGDATGGDSSGSGSNAPPPTNIDSGTKGKHVVGCKKAF